MLLLTFLDIYCYLLLPEVVRDFSVAVGLDRHYFLNREFNKYKLVVNTLTIEYLEIIHVPYYS